jgi:hypothetical protein
LLRSRRRHGVLHSGRRRKEHWVNVYDDMWNRFTADPNWANKLKLGMFFHVHNEKAGAGDHSVGHLHMHVFPLNDELRTNYEHDQWYHCIQYTTPVSVSYTVYSARPWYSDSEMNAR